jgi:hypothetical protein
VLYAGEQIGDWIGDGTARPPKADEGILHDIFGVGPAGHDLPREQDKGRAVPVEPGLPVVACIRHLDPL